MNIAVVGSQGKLGLSITQELINSGHNVTQIDICLNNCLCDFTNVNAVIDCSTASESIKSAQYCSLNNIPLLIACTGHNKQQLMQIDDLCKKIAYCVCPNLSVGVQFVLKSLISLKMLNNPSISIVEQHHINKKDSPSGTALAMKNQIEKSIDICPSIVSIRKGNIVGTHTINILLPYEDITITHKANNRKVFATGAVIAINKLLNALPNKYSFIELLENQYEN